MYFSRCVLLYELSKSFNGQVCYCINLVRLSIDMCVIV